MAKAKASKRLIRQAVKAYSRGDGKKFASIMQNVKPTSQTSFDPIAAPAGNPQTSLEGASQARRLSPWLPRREHINSILNAELPLLRARTRQLIANTAHGSNASETFTSYAAGTGIVPSPLISSAGQKKQVTQAFRDWTDEADADGLTDFYGLQSLAARALFDAGEVFIRRRDRRAADGLTVPLQLQLLESEQLDVGFTSINPANGNKIRMGIEFNAIGKRVGYWFFRDHPGDYTATNTRSMERTFIPADQIIHCYKPLRPGQIRGKPWLTAGMVTLYDFDQYSDAELVRKKGAAMFMSFVTQELGDDPWNSGIVDDDAPVDAGGTADLVAEPGLMQMLPKGTGVTFNEPADVGPNFEAFSYRKLLELCASMGLPYFAVTGDTSKANYSSLRAALLEAKRRIEKFQWEVLIFQMCRQVYAWWLPAAVVSGAVRLPGYSVNPRAYSRVKWITPKWDWVDPLKDVQAEKLQVDAGFKARSDVIEGMGEDAEETDARIAADHAREERLGLSFPVGFKSTPDAPAGADNNPTGSDTGGDVSATGQAGTENDSQQAA